MVKGEHGIFVYTTAASITISTKPCTFLGITVFASDACTITVADGANRLFLGSTATGGYITISPSVPIACANGLSVTDSGGGNYVIFYGNR